MNERERRERFLEWWNDPDTNRYMTDFNVDQAWYMWQRIEQHHIGRIVELKGQLSRMREIMKCNDPGNAPK